LQARLSTMDGEPPMLLHPNMSRVYKDKVAKLADAFKADRTDAGAFEAIRSLLDIAILHPTKTGFDFDIQGELANILALSSTGKQSAADLDTTGLKTTKPSQFALEGLGELDKQVKMVAGVRNPLSLMFKVNDMQDFVFDI
jgi:site-specific DNA recombinase